MADTRHGKRKLIRILTAIAESQEAKIGQRLEAARLMMILNGAVSRENIGDISPEMARLLGIGPEPAQEKPANP